MATEKKSFILYADLIHTVDLLSDEHAGKLFKHLLQYVNDNDPESDDLIVKLAFEPIKQSLMRDLKKFEEKKEERSKAGRMGNLKRYHPDLYDTVEGGDLDLEEAENIAKSRKRSLSDKNVANLADSDSDSDSDSVIDINKSSFKKKKRKKEKKEVPLPWNTESFKSKWDQWKIYKSKEFGFKYKSEQSEIAALGDLQEKADSNEKTAIAIIQQSMANSWKGFFEIKNENEKKLKPSFAINFGDDEPKINRQTLKTIKANSEGWG
jgi:hypothetical protein